MNFSIHEFISSNDLNGHTVGIEIKISKVSFFEFKYFIIC